MNDNIHLIYRPRPAPAGGSSGAVLSADDHVGEMRQAIEHLLHCIRRALDAERDASFSRLRNMIATEEVKSIFQWTYVPQTSYEAVQDVIREL